MPPAKRGRYAQRPMLLTFRDSTVEARYRSLVLDRTLWVCRGAWALVPALGGIFGLIDYQVFGEKAPLVLGVRASVIVVGLLVLGSTFLSRVRPWLVASSASFILLISSFCTFLVAMDDHPGMSPYFVGLFVAFTAIYTTAGVGFVQSTLALILSGAIAQLTVTFLVPVEPHLLLAYALFTLAAVVVFGYSAWIVERYSRESFVQSEQLQETLAEVKILTGLLPICAECKNVRDDRGYWNLIEEFISKRTDARFTHGLCPTCIRKLYPDLVAGEPSLINPVDNASGP